VNFENFGHTPKNKIFRLVKLFADLSTRLYFGTHLVKCNVATLLIGIYCIRYKFKNLVHLLIILQFRMESYPVINGGLFATIHKTNPSEKSPKNREKLIEAAPSV